MSNDKYTDFQKSDRTAVSHWVRKLYENGVGLRDMARIAGVTPPHISNVKSGASGASPALAARLAAAYPGAPEPVLRFAALADGSIALPPASMPAHGAAPTPPPTASESIASVLARVERKLVAGSASSREAAQRVVDCAQRYAAVVEQAHAHKLLVFLGDATGEGPSIQSAALKLYDALLGVPELAELLAQPARPQQPAEPAPQPAPVVEPPSVDPYEVVVTRKQPPPPLVVDEPEEPQISYPSLAKASQRNPLLIVGGVAIPEVRERLSKLGVQHEWIETRGSIGQNRVDAAALRIRRTHACAAMVLHGFVGHKTFDRVREAARLGIVPFIAPQKAGTAELVRALHTLDKQIANGVTQ